MTLGTYDICIIGGGINGAGIARDAAGQGLKVLLLEKGDIASATSSASSKIIHGGLRYLEHYDFNLVRKALKEREVLLDIAPHIISPLKFVLPHIPEMRNKWLIRAGLFLYDNLAKRKRIEGSKLLNIEKTPYKDDLKPAFKSTFTYGDAWCDDARLTLLNALDAKDKGATIKTRAKCEKIEQKGGHWLIHCNNNQTALAKVIINAAGPWTREFLDQNNLSKEDTPHIRLVKGSHIVIPKLYEGDHAYTLQQNDERIVFTFPYQNHFTLIGTTDVEIEKDAPVQIEKDEIDYLLNAINNAFQKQTTHKDIIWTYSGVRPLLDSGNSKASEITRDYHLRLDQTNNQHVLSIFGGKITTYRTLAEDALKTLQPVLNFKYKSWTDKSKLPGGNITKTHIEDALKTHKEWPQEMTKRLAQTYGSNVSKFNKDCGKIYDNITCEAEIKYSIENELTVTAEDFLWRRTKLGLLLKPETKEQLEKDFLQIKAKSKQND